MSGNTTIGPTAEATEAAVLAISTFSLDSEELKLVISVTLLLCGMLFMFFGSRYFKHTLFMFAFFFGAGLGFYAMTEAMEDPNAGIAGAAILGLMLGCAALKLWKLSLFILGAGVGFVAWSTMATVVPELAGDDTVKWATMIGTMIICGALAIKMEKHFLMVGTPIVGAFMFTQGIDNFVEENFNVFDVVKTGKSCDVNNAECQMIFSSVVSLSILGMFVQYKFTSEGAADRREDSKERKENKAYTEKNRSSRKERRGRKKRKQRRRRSSTPEPSPSPERERRRRKKRSGDSRGGGSRKKRERRQRRRSS